MRTFTLYGGYKMWSGLSNNCTIAGLEVMRDSEATQYSLEISDNEFLSAYITRSQESIWSRRTHCEFDTAYYYYSMNKTFVLGMFANSFDDVIYSADCKWSLVVATGKKITVYKNIEQDNDDSMLGEKVWSYGTNVKSLTFNANGNLVI